MGKQDGFVVKSKVELGSGSHGENAGDTNNQFTTHMHTCHVCVYVIRQQHTHACFVDDLLCTLDDVHIFSVVVMYE